MTDKTEAQPEALRLAEFFESLTKSSHRWWDGVPVHEKAASVLRAQTTEIEQIKAKLTSQTNRAAAAEQQVTALTQRLDMANRLNTDARDQLAQLSARQATPDSQADAARRRLAEAFPQAADCFHPLYLEGFKSGHAKGRVRGERATLREVGALAEAVLVAPPPPEREPLTDEQIEAAYKNLQVRRKKDQDEAFQAGIGKSCMHCSEGHYQADWNGYSTFHRCDKCRHVPFDLSGLVKKSAASCWCETCRPITISDMRMVLCPDCGNKRCPKANHHDNACTNSNAPGQPGSSWEHVKPHGATND